MSYSIQCIHCKAVLKSPTPIPAGRNVKCPKCKENFTTPAASRAAPAKTTLASDAPEPTPEPETPPSEPEPTPEPEPPVPEEPVATSDADAVDEVDEVDEVEEPEDEGEFADIDIEIADEKPRKKTKRGDDDDDDDDDDKPRRRRRNRDDDEDDSSSDRKKAKKKGPPIMLIAGIGGAVVVLLLCCVTGIVGLLFYSRSKPDIIGRWQQEHLLGGMANIYEFRPDGTATITTRGFVNMNPVALNFTYTQNGNELTLNQNIPIKYEVTRTGNTLQLRPPGAPADFRWIELRKLD